MSQGETSGAAPSVEVFHSDTATVMKRNPWWLLLGASPWIIGLGSMLTALVTSKAAFLAPLFHLAIFGGVGFGFLYKANKDPRFLAGEVLADAEAVRFRGEVIARRDEIKQGFVVPHRGRHVVRLARKGFRPNVEIAVKDVAEGRALLKTLGLDASQSVARINAMSHVFSWSPVKQLALFMSPMLGAFAGVMGGGLAFGPTGVAAGMLALFAALAAMMTLIIARTHVEIGADGILTRWFGKERFFPFSQIEWVNPFESKQLSKTYLGVELVLRSGESVRIQVGQKRWADEEQEMVVERIREAIEAYSSGMAGADASILGRNGRAPKDWITSLRSIGAGANADMRTSPIPLERLWRIVEDASASAVARASAAIALAPQVPPSERRRIRIAAQATASPKLRVALEHASDHDISDDALAESLAELEAEGAVAPKVAAHA